MIDLADVNDDLKLTLARAFDFAWQRFIEREGAGADTDANRKRLASRLVALAKSGDFDEDQLGESALIYLCVMAEAVRLGAKRERERPNGAATEETASPGSQAFAPDTVAAMSSALDLCLDDLPFRISSDVVAHLTKTILDEATRGERDPQRLSQAALNALKAR